MRLILQGFPQRRGASVLSCAALIFAAALTAGCSNGASANDRSPLHHTFDSPESLSRAVLRSLADRDDNTLANLALSELEFRTVVWPELPSSRPTHGVPFEYAWGDLRQKSTNALRRLVASTGGRQFGLVRVAFEGESTAYDTFTVHRETVLTIRDEEGLKITEALFGSILERDGEYKLFSYVVD